MSNENLLEECVCTEFYGRAERCYSPEMRHGITGLPRTMFSVTTTLTLLTYR